MGKKIVGYEISYNEDSDDLVVSVRVMIEKGWQPFGSLMEDANGYFHQAMVKYEEK